MSQRILVIDDDADVRETIRIALEAEGYEVVDAGDGQQGLAAFRRRVPDLVITDIVMPDHRRAADDSRDPSPAAGGAHPRRFRRRTRRAA